MYLKIVSILDDGHSDSHLIEADHFNWKWAVQWPEDYLCIPFISTIFDDENKAVDTNVLSHVVVVDVFKSERFEWGLVIFKGHGFFMNENGKTIDKFTV